jgi:hypothetical protein
LHQHACRLADWQVFGTPCSYACSTGDASNHSFCQVLTLSCLPRCCAARSCTTFLRHQRSPYIELPLHTFLRLKDHPEEGTQYFLYTLWPRR